MRSLFVAAFAAITTGAYASETVNTTFALSDGFTTGGTADVTISSGAFEVTFSGGQQQQSFDGPSYNTGPDAYLFISGPSFTGSFGQSALGTGDKGLIDFNVGVSEASLFVANRALGAATTVRVFGRDDTTILDEISVSQTSIRPEANPTQTVIDAAAYGALIGSIEIDNPGPAGNPPYVTAIDTFSARTDVIYAEEVSGDLANGGADLPTAVSFSEGSNIVTGSVTTAGGDTRDYLTFTIDPGFQLDAILQLEYDDPALAGSLFDGNRGFYALLDGVSGAIPGSGFDNLGGDHLDPIGFGADLLAGIADGGISGGTGFSTPLGAGTYTFQVQQTGPQISNYALDFVVAQVPEPTSAALTALVAVGSSILRFRSRR